jgi:carbonic anhydrase
MADEIQELLNRNRSWAKKIEEEDPGFFARLTKQQKPRFLWIGCSDSRVPANQITGLMPGEVFVHRNVANVVLQTDLNCMSVVEFAIKKIKVRHVIICGHYGCAGVVAALETSTGGIIDHWLSGIRSLSSRNKAELESMTPEAAQSRLCELNVIDQVNSLCHTGAINDAWRRGQKVDVHGWIYGLEDGLIQDLGIRVACPEDLERIGGT